MNKIEYLSLCSRINWCIGLGDVIGNWRDRIEEFDMGGKVDFIVCEEGGSWYLESLDLPEEVAVRSNGEILEYVKRERFRDEVGVVYVGVYWRDEILDEMGMMPEAAVRHVMGVGN